ncbi:MAG: FAD:protein FMN transferase [Cyclobacteriaceae bacterium]
MTSKFKNAIYSIFLILLIWIVWKFRSADRPEPIILTGKTMGTTYRIIYFDKAQKNYQAEVDSSLQVFNKSLSTYLQDSEISLFNNGRSITFSLPYFLPVLNRSAEIVKESDGAFDPTVMPLVNAWGFGPGKKSTPDSLQIDSIMQFVGFDKIQFNKDSVWKLDARVQLDFSAIAKGYGVDVVTSLIKSHGVEDLFVEIGGEISAHGKNRQLDKAWEAGILDPDSDYAHQSFKAYVSLSDKAMATSGNYFNYYEVDGKKYSHTINPKTGYSIRHELLSASVFADDCMTADAWATAFMVMGADKAMSTLSNQTAIDAFLIYTSPSGLKTYVTKGIESVLKVNP